MPVRRPKAAPRRVPQRPLPLRRWLRHLARHVEPAIVGADPEGVHQVRVAAGRLSVWLEMGGHAALRDDLRVLRGSAAAVRDCDVLLGGGAAEPFAARLVARREAARGTMVAHLRSPHFRALRLALGVLPPLDRATAEESIEAFRDRVLRRGDRLAGAASPHDEEFHSVRRALRKLRYAMEWLGWDASPVKALQQGFGDLNDLAVEARLLDETGAAADLAGYCAALRGRIATLRREALRDWLAAHAKIAGIERSHTSDRADPHAVRRPGRSAGRGRAP